MDGFARHDAHMLARIQSCSTGMLPYFGTGSETGSVTQVRVRYIYIYIYLL